LSADNGERWKTRAIGVLVRSERFELPTLGFEVRCSIQLSYERVNDFNDLAAQAIFWLFWLWLSSPPSDASDKVVRI
jgi:hypothetical protein